MKQKSSTSWQNVSSWYDDTVGSEGHYYHQSIIIPKVLELCNFSKNSPQSLLDLACGQGVLSRALPTSIAYTGIDSAPSLIAAAKKYPHPSHHSFYVGDITQKLPLQENKTFSHASLILALQNIENPQAVFKNAFHFLEPQGLFIIVLNHPCFRIPRQSSWKIDPEQKMQYRRIDRYMTSLKIPIQTHPGQGHNSSSTFSFHHPLSDYSRWLHEEGFSIRLLEEWCSDKTSEGKAAKMENRSRQEIPLFMTLVAQKK